LQHQFFKGNAMSARSFGIALSLFSLLSATTPVFAQDAMLLASGDFRDGAAGHTGSGQAAIGKNAVGEYVLALQEFSTTPGPDLEVWLVKAANITSADQVLGSDHLSLGALRSPKGDQSYAIPAGVVPDDYASVVIWCESFSVLFATADLTISSM